MRDGVVVALDAGGSYVKATSFDAEGTAVTAGEPVRLQHPSAGANERDAQELWEAACRCVAQVLAAVPGGSSRVVAVGVTGHGNGAYLVDSAGHPTRPAIMAADCRASDAVRTWGARGMKERLRPHAWNGLWAGQPGPILSHLARHEPAVLEQSHALLSCKDYLRARLTGAVTTELSDATAGGLYDNQPLTKGATTILPGPAQLEAFGLLGHERLLLEPVPSEAVFEVSADAASATGLLAGTAVIAGLVDNSAVQHGSGVFDSSVLCVGAGTWSINQLLVPLGDMGDMVVEVQPLAASLGLQGTALLCEASPTSASTLEWALSHAVMGGAISDRHQGLDVFEACLSREALRSRHAHDPIFVPYLDGSREDSGARGAWIGLSGAVGEADLIGAVVEGVCCEHRRHVERLEKNLHSRLPVRLSGGATKSPVWCQRFADVLGRQVQTSPVSELGSLGVSALAGAAVGVFDSVEHGVDQLSPGWLTYHPNPRETELAEERFARYLRWAEILEHEVWA